MLFLFLGMFKLELDPKATKIDLSVLEGNETKKHFIRLLAADRGAYAILNSCLQQSMSPEYQSPNNSLNKK